MDRPDVVPEHATLYSIGGRTRFHGYTSGGVPTNTMYVLWSWVTDTDACMYTQNVEPTQEELDEVNSLEMRGSNGAVLSMTYGEWRQKHAD